MKFTAARARLAAFLERLFCNWSDRFGRLQLLRRNALKSLRPVKLSLATMEERIVPARPLPLPFVFAGAGEGAPSMVRSYRADTGELAFEAQPFAAGFGGGVRVAAGDINHDGIPDLIAAAGPGGGPNVKVLDGITGQQIAGPLGSFMAYDRNFGGGVQVTSGDVDGDGFADIVTVAGAGGGPHVKAFSGRTGTLLASFYAFAPEFDGGATIASADFNNDGRADLAVGAGAGGGPHVKVFDFVTGTTIAGPLGSFYAFDSTMTAGVNVGSDFLAGDVTGDGRADIAVGTGPGVATKVRVFDGVTGGVVGEFSPFAPGVTAGARVSTAYVDDDDRADIVVGTGAGVAATIRVFGGADLTELATPMSPYTPFGSAFTGGLYVASSNDPDLTTGTVALSNGSTIASGASQTMTLTLDDANTANGVQNPTGTVTFSAVQGSTSTVLGTATLVWSGTAGRSVATFTKNPLVVTAGTGYTVAAAYSGDSQFASSTNSSSTFEVVGATLSSPSLRTMPYGGYGSLTAPVAGDTNYGELARIGGVGDDGAVYVDLFDGIEGGPAWSASETMLGTLTWSNATGYVDPTATNGSGVVNQLVARMAVQADGSLALIDGAGSAVVFDAVSGGTYASRLGNATLVQNASTGELIYQDGSGAKAYFYDFGFGTPTGRAGRLKRRESGRREAERRRFGGRHRRGR